MRQMSISKSFCAQCISSLTQRHFKKSHDNSSTTSTAAQTNLHLENTWYYPKIDTASQYAPPKSTHQILSAPKIPYTGYDDTQKWIPHHHQKNNEEKHSLVLRRSSVLPPLLCLRGELLSGVNMMLMMHDIYGRSPQMVKLLAVLTILVLVDGVCFLHSMRDCIVLLSEVRSSE
jgi:hypothetical protein